MHDSYYDDKSWHGQHIGRQLRHAGDSKLIFMFIAKFIFTSFYDCEIFCSYLKLSRFSYRIIKVDNLKRPHNLIARIT